MKRHYFISDDLDDLERIEEELEQKGISRPQIHVLSNNDAGVANHKHLHNIEAIFKQDIVRGTLAGLMIGAIAAMFVISVGYVTNLPETYTWMPFYFLAIVMFGFITWSGGFYGIQTPHKDFRRFQEDLKNGKHIFIVDVDSAQEEILQQIKSRHPHMNVAGTGSATPRWIIMGQQNFKNITTTTFP
ncbi:NAD/FAD-utilizing enzyme apparently involved in cell division [hydrothermal vent metagenome]|uniref:NAD/FAD-utilizing enzyme apparently involved in cell division n=1 Tax=hydrothermal vent metagenome TaxID=652676 RepID=A0A3B0WHR8_9ZZZZ